MGEVSDAWFEEAKKLEVGKAIYIRVADKTEQISIEKELKAARDEYATVDPVHASQIFITRTIKEFKQYVVIDRKYRAPFTAFMCDVATGNFSKISIDPDRKCIIKLMLKDRKSRSEIEEVLGGLAEDEIQLYFPIK